MVLNGAHDDINNKFTETPHYLRYEQKNEANLSTLEFTDEVQYDEERRGEKAINLPDAPSGFINEVEAQQDDVFEASENDSLLLDS